MSHMVIYRGIDGKPGYQQADDIHDAVAFVESKRNDEGVEQARIFRLEEVVFEYRPYYRVELSGHGLELDQTDVEGDLGVDSGGPLVEPELVAAPAPEITGDINVENFASVSQEVYASDNGVVISVDEDNQSEVVGNGAPRGLFGR